MQTFTDIHGRTWTVAISIGTVKRVKNRLGIDMLDIQPFMKQVQDIMTLCDVLYVVCQDEAEKNGMTDEQFASVLAGPTLRTAREAFMEAFLAFFPDPKIGAKLRVVKDKYNAVGDRMLALVEKKMPQIVNRIDREVENVLAEMEKQIDRETIGKSLTNSPESSE
jgi:hypothetical protein